MPIVVRFDSRRRASGERQQGSSHEVTGCREGTACGASRTRSVLYRPHGQSLLAVLFESQLPLLIQGLLRRTLNVLARQERMKIKR